MAHSIGGKIKNFLVLFLIGLLVLAFAVWGVTDIFVPGVKNSVVSVGNASVTTREFDRDMQVRLRAIAEQRGEGLTNEEAFQQRIHEELLGSYQARLVIEKDAEDLGVGVNRADAKAAIESNPVFTSEVTQEFSREKLEQVLANSRRGRITMKEYQEEVLQNLRRIQTMESIVGGIQAPAGFAKREFDFFSEQRKAKILTITKDAVPTPETPTDEVLQAYLDTNAARYTAPEYRRITMIRLEPTGFLPDIAETITEEDVKAEYDGRIARGALGTKGTRDVVVLTAPDQPTAEEAATRLKAGETPDLVATALGLLSPDRFDAVEKDQLLDPETDNAAFALAEGEAKASLNSLGTWEAVFVPSLTEASLPSFASAERDIRLALADNKAKAKLFEISDELDDRLVNGENLESIATDLNLSMESYDYINRSGQTRDGLTLNGSQSIPGIAQDDELLRRIFTEDIGFDTDIIQTVHEGYASFRVTDVIDSKIKPLDDVREELLLAWETEQINEAITKRGLDLAEEIRGGRTLEEIAEELGSAAVLEDRVLTRENPPRDLSRQVVIELLTTEVGELARGTGAVPLTYSLGRLDQIIPNADGLAGENLENRQNIVGAQVTSDILEAYRIAVLKEHKLREYDNQIFAVLGIDPR